MFFSFAVPDATRLQASTDRNAWYSVGRHVKWPRSCRENTIDLTYPQSKMDERTETTVLAYKATGKPQLGIALGVRTRAL
jgi:hypothetical protein